VRIDATGIEEIVVTATRRAEALSRVPISATALNQARLEDQGLRTIADMPRSVPGLQFLPETNSVAIRGIASSAGAATTGVYIDEAPIQMLNVGIGTRSAIPALYDLERVEVLRGPQGTLFGAGAQGGAVRYITAQPSTTVYTAEADWRVGWVEGGWPGCGSVRHRRRPARRWATRRPGQRLHPADGRVDRPPRLSELRPG
jgi:outer membrane receptor protein involved in Fe transport